MHLGFDELNFGTLNWYSSLQSSHEIWVGKWLRIKFYFTHGRQLIGLKRTYNTANSLQCIKSNAINNTCARLVNWIIKIYNRKNFDDKLIQWKSKQITSIWFLKYQISNLMNFSQSYLLIRKSEDEWNEILLMCVNMYINNNIHIYRLNYCTKYNTSYQMKMMRFKVA